MRFDEIPAGASVFVDANVFIYAFAGEANLGGPCTDLLERIERRELVGSISASILSEVAHRLMTLEACQAFGWPYPGIAQRLRRDLDQISRLHQFRAALVEIAAIGLTIYPVADQDVLRAAELSRQHGLLSNDALLVSVLEHYDISLLASNDADFDRVPGLTRYAPK